VARPAKAPKPTAPVQETIPDLAPATAAGNMYFAMAQNLTLALHNAVAAQQQTNRACQPRPLPSVFANRVCDALTILSLRLRL
jgi:hypothetical protein